jgi:heme oxygenase
MISNSHHPRADTLAHGAPAPESPDDTLSSQLKHATSELHTRVERHPAQAGMMRGGTTLGAYGAYLSQMLRVQVALDAACARAAGLSEGFASVWKDYHPRAHRARADLASLALREEPPLPATIRMAAWIEGLLGASGAEGAESTGVASLLGVLYVLEGSTNGGPYIAAALRKSLGLSAASGTDYLSPHGTHQRERWGAFKRNLDALRLAPTDRDAAIEAARRTFLSIEAIFDDLAKRA